MSNEEESISKSESSIEIPRWIQGILSAILLIIIGTCLYLFWSHINDPTKANPKDMELSNLLIFSLGLLLVILIPWEKLGFRIKKIGVIEFEQIVATQSKEHAEDIEELKKKLISLEKKLTTPMREPSKELLGLEGASLGLEGAALGIKDATSEEEAATPKEEKKFELADLLVEFLGAYARSSFSPLRIRNWGGEQKRFEKFKNYGTSEIKSELRSLLVQDKVETRISKKGNTLYKIKP